MRIVAGRHKGRRLTAPDGRVARPTADRVRQALFDILMHSDLVEMDGALVLDAFAGTGALGLEALSRGASHAVFLERDRRSLDALNANIAALNEQGRTKVMSGDATRPPKSLHACTLAFLDPPYGQDLAGPCLAALAAGGWLAPEALVVLEVAADEAFTPPTAFELADERERGPARLIFLIHRGTA
jgi:16S rRNA (guanine966-N2)-methyltransferase